LSLEESNTREWVKWVNVVSSAPLSEALFQHSEDLTRAIAFFASLPSEVSLKNTRHFAELQALRSSQTDLSYRCAQVLEQQAQRGVVAPSEWDNVLEHMQSAGSPQEDLVLVYRHMKDHRAYLSTLVNVYEAHERNPLQLKRPLELPPMFFNVNLWTLEDCNLASILMDIAIKKLWWEGERSEQHWLLPLSQRYERLGFVVRARDVLALAPLERRSSALMSELKRLIELSKASRVDLSDQDDLY
jgi:hypothetical protein